MSAKDLVVKPISSADARRVIAKNHYSGGSTNNSQLHFGIFYNGRVEGALQFGPPIDKRKLLPLVEGSQWNDFLELNRMAFSEVLPRNSESRAIAICMRLIKKHYPHLKWIVSFADGTQCGDGTIYRASGFVLTNINSNKTMCRLADGSIAANHGTSKKDFKGAVKLKGFQLRYIYFLDKSVKEKLTVPIIPFSKIDEMGAGMYKGKAREQQATTETIGRAAGQHRPSRSNQEATNAS